MIKSSILEIHCRVCGKLNQISYQNSVPIKFQCQHCDHIINVFSEKDTITETRVTIGKGGLK